MATANSDGSITLSTKVDTSGIKSGMSSIKGAVGKIGGLMAAAFSVKVISNFTKEAVNLYKIQMQNEVKLATVMRERVNATDDQIQSILNLTAAEQGLGIIGDEVQIAGLQQLATFAKQTETIETLLPAMNNLIAQQYGFEASTGSAVNVANLMGKVLQGQTGALTRVGITFTEAQEQVLKYGTESQRAATLAQVITDNVGDMNAALAQTDAGRQQQLANTIGDIKEQFGEAANQIAILFLPALRSVATLLSDIADVAKVFASSIAAAFGAKSNEKQWAQISKDSKKTVGNIDDQTDAQKSLNEQVKKTLSGFDEINTLSGSEVQNTGAESTSPQIGVAVSSDKNEEVEKEMSALEKTIKKVVKRIQKYFEPLRNISFYNLKASFDNLMVSLNPYKDLVLEGLDWLWNGFLIPASQWVVEDVLPQYLNLISEKLSILSPAIDLIRDGLSWLWNEIIIPMGMWVAENVVPTFIDTVASSISSLTPIIEAIKPTLSWLWNEIITPMATFVGDAFTDFLGFLTKKFTAFSDWASKNKETVRNIFDLTLGFLAGVWTYNTTKKILDFLPKLGKAFTDLGAKMAEGGLKGAFFAAAVGILAAGIVSLAKNWDKMTPAERAITILGGLAAAATAAAIAIGIFHTAWTVGVAAAAIAGGLALLGLSFAFSDTGDTGDAAKTAADNFYSSYDWNKDFSLPKLAQGAVIPPNREFLAVLGDQKSGTNIEAPLDTIKQAVYEVLAGSGFGGGEQTIVVPLYLNDVEIARAVKEAGRKMGTQTVTGGFANAY